MSTSDGKPRSLKWWARPDLNRGPSDYESPALTAELRAHADPQHLIFWLSPK